jgi:hypothetical protein
MFFHRARLLKQQRLERQKSAKERRDTQHNNQKERWKKSSHFDCAKGLFLPPACNQSLLSPTCIDFPVSPNM